ncbi:MAG TPA: hypothetical protein VLL77_06295 [Anaerolineales bacterium]|nr:hypothetical protein [Anaerolineales bacterium]
MRSGDIVSWKRTFTEDDVRAFSRITGDEGSHHVHPDLQGRLMVQGLLTASLPTKIGGDLDYLAQAMHFQFHHPVFTGETIECQVRIEAVETDARGSRLSCTFVCTNQDGTVVLTGDSQGRLRKDDRTPG